MPPLSFFATCPRSVEDLLLGEVNAAGGAEAKETVSGVRFGGTLTVAYTLCLTSRFASRILLPVAEFPAHSPEELIAGVREVDWSEHLGLDDTFAVEATTTASQLRHADYAALVVKDGIADVFRERFGSRPNVQPRDPDLRISLHIAHDVATVAIDLSGGSLHRRSYRVRGVAAPLKENVAAAMLARARWEEIAAEGGPLVDPMCGSGTLLIEGALMAGGIAPGLLRLMGPAERDGSTGLREAAARLAEVGAAREAALPQGWRGNDGDSWAGVVRESAGRVSAGWARIPPVFGFDHDRAAVAAAEANIQAAGLGGLITVWRSELKELTPPTEHPGLVAVNPPYGERIAGKEPVGELYEGMGRIFHDRFAGWTACVLTSEEELSRRIGLRAERTNVLFNGPIRCLLAHFSLTPDNRFRPYRKQGEAAKPGGDRQPIPAPAIASRSARSAAARNRPPEGASSTGEARDETSGILTFVNRIRKKRKLLEKWARQNGVSCYRIYDADLPEYAVAVDLFEGRWLHVQEYVAPASIDPDKATSRLDDVVTVLPELLEITPEQVYLKRRKRRRRTEQYTRIGSSGEFFQVHEGGYSFLVNFTDYLDTGLFLDHRLTRRMIGSAAAGKRFLNLFAYTATASVYAVKGGAVATTSIDSSNTYLRWARENYTANGIAGQQHRLLRADCWEWLQSDRDEYDLIFLDPPTFSNAKGKRATLDIQRDHVRLIRLTVDRLAPGGELLFSTNFRRFRLDRAALTGLTIEDITLKTIPYDFSRNRRIHLCFRITRSS